MKKYEYTLSVLVEDEPIKHMNEQAAQVIMKTLRL